MADPSSPPLIATSDVVLSREELASELALLLQGVKGVDAIYDAHHPPSDSQNGRPEDSRSPEHRLVKVSEYSLPLQVTACLGVSHTEPAPVIGRRALSELTNYFRDRGQTPPLSVRVEIGRIQ